MLEKQFDPQQTEKTARQAWSEANYRPHGQGSAYCIMLPPPNVTGTLHMGHGFQHTIMDALIRYHRMLGDQTLWQPGTDHAGISTQMVVEKQLTQEGLDRKTMGREAFEQRVWQWKQQSGDTILKQMKKLGATCDWSRLRFTMDPDLSKSVTTAFVKLYQDQLIYRGTRLVNWDPVLQTALSDLEVTHEEEERNLWHLRYPCVNGQDSLVVATTRPETFFGDVAVAVHPDDTRYQKFIGCLLHLPLTDRQIPVIADDSVDMEFGTACVKITPAHDFNDFEVGKRHHLKPINIFTTEACLNQNVPVQYQGLSREEARKRVITDFTALGLMEKIESHQLKVPRSERSGTIVEPYLSQQWYLKMETLAKPALEVVENGTIEFIPETWHNTYRYWMNNIQDWCISRQLWWGHRIPVWYDETGAIYVAHDEAEAQAQAGPGVLLTQETDVLDTWFSAALWPFSALGWPSNTAELALFYPTQVLVTGFDIIFFWVARMIMFGLYFTQKIPFKQVLITGLIRDQDGQKMSKSKGNVIDPLDLIDGISLEDLLNKRTSGLLLASQKQMIEKATRKQFPQGIQAFGEDAVRFSYCAMATHGRDLRFDLSRTEGYRNFCNKIWNATRFIQMQLEKSAIVHLPAAMPNFEECDLPEQWLIAKLNDLIAHCEKYFNEYRFDLLAQCLYEFTWYEFCDWSIEFAKIRLNEKIDEKILQVLVNALEILLRLLHPLMPFITEDLWQQALRPILELPCGALMCQTFPQQLEIDSRVSNPAISLVEQLKTVVLGVRQIRSVYQIEPKKILPMAYIKSLTDAISPADSSLRNNTLLLTLIKELGKIEQVEMADRTKIFGDDYGHSSGAGSLTVYIPLAGLIDLDAQKKRVEKEIIKLKAELLILNQRLENPKAPAEIVQKWQERKKEISVALSTTGETND